MSKHGHKMLLPLVVLVIVALALGACAKATPAPPTNTPVPPAPTEAPPTATSAPAATEAPSGGESTANAVTARQVQQLIMDTFNTPNRDLALWNIQPGLGTVMIEYGYRMATAYLAVQNEDWGMAQYQIKEATEIQEVGETTRPKNADLLKKFEHKYLDPLVQDILAKDQAAFDKDYEAAIEGCNACHKATGHPYVQIQPPQSMPEAFILTLGTSEPEEGKEEEHASGSGAQASYPSTPPTLDDAQKLLTDLMNTPDRSLALWAIQPGLGTVMREYGYRFALLWYAADAQDWGMAQYQLKEATEIQEVGETTRPKNADLLKKFEHKYLDPLAQDIQNQDLEAFKADYQSAVDGCNACHKATGHPYVHIAIPTSMPVDYLQLVPSTP